MARAFLLTSMLLVVAPLLRLPVVRPAWKENGFIGSCPARGCIGRRNLCSVYSFPGADGERYIFFCYWD